MPDGTQYVLEDEASVGRFGLSPDGRWLAWTDSFWPGTGTMHVRDLTGTKEITFGEDGGSSRELHATAWSPQSKYLLVYVSYGTQARVDLATGAVLTFTTTASQIDMVLDSGELLAIMNRNPDELVSIDAVTGAETSKFQITGLNTEDVRSVWPAPAACSCSAWCSSTPGTATSIIR